MPERKTSTKINKVLSGSLVLSGGIALLLLTFSDKLSYSLFMLILIAVPLTILVVIKPFLGLCLIFISIPLDIYSYDAGFLTISPTNILIIVTMISWIIALLRGRYDFYWDKDYLFLAWLFVASIVPLFFISSSIPHLRSIVTLLGSIAAYLLCVNLVDSRAEFKTIIRILIISTLIISITVIIQSIAKGVFGIDLEIGSRTFIEIERGLGYLPRSTSIFRDSNALGYFLLPGLMILIYLYVIKKASSRRLLSISFVSIIALAILISYSRGTWLGVFVSLVCLIVIPAALEKPKYRPFIIILFALIIALLIMTPIGIITNEFIVTPFKNIQQQNVDIRLQIWSDAIKKFSSSPIVGIGMGSYRYDHGMELVIHNTYLQVLVGFGIFGFIPFFMLIVRSIMKGISGMKNNDDIAFALLLGFIALLSAGFFINSFQTKYFWLLMALITVSAKTFNRNRG